MTKVWGGRGYTLEKFFSTDLHKLEKQSKTKVGGNFPLLPLLAAPLPTGYIVVGAILQKSLKSICSIQNVPSFFPTFPEGHATDPVDSI